MCIYVCAHNHQMQLFFPKMSTYQTRQLVIYHLGERLEKYLNIIMQDYPDGVFVRVTIAVKKHHDWVQAVNNTFYLDYTYTALFLTEGSQDSNSKRVEHGGQDLM